MDIIGTILGILAGIVGMIITVCYFHSNFYIVLPLILKRKTKQAKADHRYGFLICARNEEAVIGDLIKSIKSQNYPQELIKIYVMADNCTDSTAECACMAGATKVFERFNKQEVGKGYALKALCKEILKDDEAMECEGFFVFDADNLLDKDYTARMNDAFDSGARIATGYRSTSNFNDGFLAAACGYYFIRDCYTMHNSRTLIGSSTMVTGTGWLFAADILKKENGWNYTLLAEDSEFTVDQVSKGEKSVYCHDAIFYDEQPNTFLQSWKQRKRWLKGTAQVISHYWKPLLRGIFKNKGNRFACYDLLVSLAAAAHMTAIAFIVGAANCFYSMIRAASVSEALIIALAFVLGLYVAFLMMAVVPVLACHKRIPMSFSKKLAYLLLFPFYMATYMPIAVSAVFGKKTEWVPIKHGESKERRFYM
ncbi:MAG: glycosyltransferase family 2 protein [Clostridia bacterium]|nr:glycosyltransferase family 2 protein [Clostridia bacterium]